MFFSYAKILLSGETRLTISMFVLFYLVFSPLPNITSQSFFVSPAVNLYSTHFCKFSQFIEDRRVTLFLCGLNLQIIEEAIIYFRRGCSLNAKKRENRKIKNLCKIYLNLMVCTTGESF